MIVMLTAILICAFFAFTLRGGGLHNHLVAEAEVICQAEGFETAREYPQRLPDGETDFIDLAVWPEKYGDHLICVEVETTPRNVVSNVLKADRLGCPLIVLVPTVAVRRAVRRKLKLAGLQYRPGGMAVCVLLLGQLKAALRNCLPLNSAANTPSENPKNKQSNQSKEGR
jgi:hypothetical protein